ncbi:sigma-70 family RNA polymerase sigma factor [Planotetraspora kaengkrachanensis]|uniref:RNA polymerase sigma factor n=1 Tax=Planotetraspora kaengkrachanensis TaxID=575193 RepID=A0A8J3PQF6_9ACTN|nr:sigma-70 family RNA polymerase sigma factor [Planotetraspora kaengkrachanensis]GIG76878.1 hypothetical protein Pka01_00050 [Planotetraspora kaengkrachanensis]
MNPSDGELVARAATGDAEAFHELVRRHRPMARGLAGHLARGPDAADDLVQEGFLQAWTSLPSLNDGDRFGSWLHGILLNLSRRWSLPRESPLDPYADGDAVDPFEAIEARWLVRDAVRDLPAGSREVVLLFYYDDLSVDQVARALDLSPSAVKVRLYRGRRRLRETLAGEFPRSPRRTSMIPVRIAMIVPAAPRLLLMLHDEPGERVLPLWLEAPEMLGRSTRLAGHILTSTGAALEAVELTSGGEARLRLRVPSGDQVLDVRAAEGLALAHRQRCPILVPDDGLVPLTGSMTVEQAAEEAVRHAGVPAASAALRRGERVEEPRNLDFSDGLRFWDLRGGFLHDPSGAHWRDYTCGARDGVAWLASAVDRPLGFADLRQAVVAGSRQGSRVRLTAEVRYTRHTSHDAGSEAALYLRVVDPDRSRGAEDHQHMAVIAPGDEWRPLNVKARIPDDAVLLLFGVTLSGPGTIEMRRVGLTAD